MDTLGTRDVTIRDAERKDLDAIAALWEQLIDLHHELDDRFWIRAHDGSDKFRSWMAEGLAAENRVLIVADVRDEVVGFIHGSVNKSVPVMAPKLVAFVTDLVVAKAHRRCGIGIRLVEAANRWFRQRGAEEVTLNVAVRNREAREFWETMGFEAWTQTLWKPLV